MLMIVILLFFWPRTVMNVNRPIPEGYCPLFKMAEDRFFSAITDISPGFDVEFHGKLIQKNSSWIFVFSRFCEVSVKILLSHGVSSGYLFQLNKLDLPLFRLESYIDVGGSALLNQSPFHWCSYSEFLGFLFLLGSLYPLCVHWFWFFFPCWMLIGCSGWVLVEESL